MPADPAAPAGAYRLAAAVGSPYLTLDEAAAYCRRSPKTLKNARAAGRLAAVGFGRKALYTRPELDRWLSAG